MQFQQKLKDIQDYVLSLDYSKPIKSFHKEDPIPEPQYLDKRFYPQPFFPKQDQYQNQQIQEKFVEWPEDTSSSEEEYDIQPISNRNNLQKRKQTIMKNQSNYIKQLQEQVDQQKNLLQKLTKSALLTQKKKSNHNNIKLNIQSQARQLELREFEETLLQRQEAMLSKIRKDVLEAIDPYRYHAPYLNWSRIRMQPIPQYQKYPQFPIITKY